MTIKNEELIDMISISCENLSIISRLELVRNLICERNGDSDDPNYDPFLELAQKLVNNVVLVLETYPDAADLRMHEPNSEIRRKLWKSSTGAIKVAGLTMQGCIQFSFRLRLPKFTNCEESHA